MSILSNPQGYPERVWSLLAGLQALGGRSSRADFEALLNPGFTADDRNVQTEPSLARNASGAASSLGLILLDLEEASVGEGVQASTYEEFADLVHDRLAALESEAPDSVILEAYAWVAAETDRQGGSFWIYETTREAFPDHANGVLTASEGEGPALNTTKVPAWRRWLSFLGLGIPLPLGQGNPDLPLPSTRLVRELDRSDLPRGEEIEAAAFLQTVAARLPYLDGGRLYTEACRRIGHAPRGALSPLLSAALRDLHDAGKLVLRTRGDAAGAARLAADRAHPVQTFSAVWLGDGPKVAQ